MKSYLIRNASGEQGPLGEEQVAQMFADGAVNRDTPCKVSDGNEWKTVDDYMPMLKYGTQLPAPTSSVVRSEDPGFYGVPPLPRAVVRPDARVSVVDFDMPFGSILKLMFKWMAAGFIVFCCFIPAFILLAFIVMAIFGTLLSGLFAGMHHP